VRGEVVLLQMQLGQRGQRGGILGRGLQRRLHFFTGGRRVVQVVELQQRQLEVQLGDAAQAVGAATGALDVDPLLERARRCVREAGAPQVAQQRRQHLVVGDSVDAQVAQ